MKSIQSLQVFRKSNVFSPDQTRVLARPFIPPKDRLLKRIERIMSLSEKETSKFLNEVLLDFSKRHKNIKRKFETNYRNIEIYIQNKKSLSINKQLLIGSCFTMEYSIESAAFFNPSIVLHPFQEDLKKGSTRILISFRAVGEGHISSITFRSGIINNQNNLTLDPVSPFVESPEIKKDPFYDKKHFIIKLKEMKAYNAFSNDIIEHLPERFLYEELMNGIGICEQNQNLNKDLIPLKQKTLEEIKWVAQSNYELTFHADQDLSERVIFPVSDNERNGLEDARFVKFENSPTNFTYYATYTAFDGVTILPQLIKTDDFVHFKVNTLNGNAVQNKGSALFSRKINDKFVMVTRKDNENIYIAFSDNIYFWHESKLLLEPKFFWEVIQIGNCGSPIETKAGWLLITHGVGSLRKYCIGAVLLDLNDPSKVVGRLKDPIIIPNETEREGYVPNVVYSCGSIIHNDVLVIPYGMSDTLSGIATIPLAPLLQKLQQSLS